MGKMLILWILGVPLTLLIILITIWDHLIKS